MTKETSKADKCITGRTKGKKGRLLKLGWV